MKSHCNVWKWTVETGRQITNALLNVAPGRPMPMTGVGVPFLPVRVFTQQLFKKAKSKLSRETPTPVIGIHRP